MSLPEVFNEIFSALFYGAIQIYFIFADIVLAFGARGIIVTLIVIYILVSRFFSSSSSGSSDTVKKKGAKKNG